MNDPNLNQWLGPYRLTKVVGRGGMGTVYAAEEESGRKVAVKVLSPVLATDPTFRERFMSEIESLKKLRHANIVQLFGFGEQDGQLYYDMELIEGTSLQQELHQGRRFGWREVTRITIDICGALKHAHDHGVIHRDLKPANLLYTVDERIKLLDFGIAKLFGNTGITTGSVMGTADYMAPEQAEGKAVGPRTDLYSLGSVMYALLAGRPPFVGKSVPEVVHKVRFEPPIPVGRLADDVPSELEQVVEQLLEKNPQKRIPTALALSHRLKAMEHAYSVRSDNPDTSKLDTAISADAEQLPSSGGLPNQPTVRLKDQDSADVTVTTRDQEEDVAVGPDHYTRVERGESAAREFSGWPWQALGSVALLLGMALAGWWLITAVSRPKSADELYDRIAAVQQESNEPRDILKVENEIKSFLSLYPDDPRSPELQLLETDAELLRLQRRFEIKARRNTAQSDSPLEHLYLEIVRQLPVAPDLAAKRLRAFVAIHSENQSLTDEEVQLIDVAKKQLAILAKQESTQASIHRPFIQAQLKVAAEAMSTNPELAASIRANLHDLYGAKPWAADLLSPR